MQRVAAGYGATEDLWPVYPDCEIDSDVPLEDAVERPTQLRSLLDDIPDNVVENDYWLNVVRRLLRAGNSFFVMV
jgi:hypothetical protein